MNNTRYLLLLLLAAMLFAGAHSSFSSPFSDVDDVNDDPQFDGKVRETSDGRYEAYMIPPFETNHASFIEYIPTSRRLVAAWFSGKSEGASDVAIVVATLDHKSNQWTTASVVSQRTDYSNQNPVIFFDHYTNRTHLFHTQQKAPNTVLLPNNLKNGNYCKEANSQIFELQSEDDGSSWSDPRIAFPIAGSYDRNRIVWTHGKGSVDQSWLLPIYYAKCDNYLTYSAVEFSSDRGLTWSEIMLANTAYLVQPSVFRIQAKGSNGHGILKAFFRDRNQRNIYMIQSEDEGIEWTTPVPTVLPNNNAAIQVITLMSGRNAIVFNNNTDDRLSITVALSEDDGVTWPYSKDLEPDGDNSGDDPTTEYAYPSLVQTQDHYINIVYTFNRQTIKYVRVNESWIMN